MDEYNMTTETAETITGGKKIHVPSLVLMIIGAVFALLLPIVTYPCSIISLIMSIVKRKDFKTTYAIVINIIVLMIAVVNSILGVMIQLGYISL